ncbi:hypothetical protein N7535_008242 [Penicillium sp. DV-2018c]|nr:hypothetical protein N7461_004280 [Penicillium sp. DV-2018c]KAJ5566604.1 hypothetical protein N7535_008242 [Penicillium sp. DV-2018c]
MDNLYASYLNNVERYRQHQPIFPFEAILVHRIAEGFSEDEAWRMTLSDGHMNRGETATATMVMNAAIVPEIPLPAPVLHRRLPTPPGAETWHETHPAINAAAENHILSICRPNDPVAQARMRDNTGRLVETCVVDRLCTEQPQAQSRPGAAASSTNNDGRRNNLLASYPHHSSFPDHRRRASDIDNVAPTIPFARVRVAHRAYQAAMDAAELQYGPFDGANTHGSGHGSYLDDIFGPDHATRGHGRGGAPEQTSGQYEGASSRALRARGNGGGRHGRRRHGRGRGGRHQAHNDRRRQ